MPIDKRKIKELLKTSRQVIRDCCLENGAIVAANADKKYYPKEAYNYRYVWPRDVSFIIVAAKILGIKDVQEPFFEWLLNRAEGFSKDGIIFQNYYTNGLKRWTNFQPDQNGTLIWAINEFYNGKPKKYLPLIKLFTEGIRRMWDKNHFIIKTQDLWEERETFPDLEDNFTYSLAACIHGLRIANNLFSNEFSIIQKEMEIQFEKAYDEKEKRFVRCFGKLNDKTVDASLLGLVYPFNVVDAKDTKILSTIFDIEKKIVFGNGVHRYETDFYDGWRYHGGDRRKGSGAWPILNFWMSIYFSKVNYKERALQYYNWMIERVDKFIPEQIFENDLQVAVSPLVWSHAMFVIATKELGFL